MVKVFCRQSCLTPAHLAQMMHRPGVKRGNKKHSLEVWSKPPKHLKLGNTPDIFAHGHRGNHLLHSLFLLFFLVAVQLCLQLKYLPWRGMQEISTKIVGSCTGSSTISPPPPALKGSRQSSLHQSSGCFASCTLPPRFKVSERDSAAFQQGSRKV